LRALFRGDCHWRDVLALTWTIQRKASGEYADRDPAVLVVGGGQAGLSIAARLTQLQVDTLIVDRWPRIGDNWRQRYHALVLHNQTHVNHLPYMPFPPTWPNYIPKDKIASWFEAYVESQELNYWTGTAFDGGSYDEANGRWTITLRRADGTTRQLCPRHVVMATGASGIPVVPDSDPEELPRHRSPFEPVRGRRGATYAASRKKHEHRHCSETEIRRRLSFHSIT
jgi:putative flavoprotein involved in K+ transport